jgi:hypothetical protein
MEYIAFFFVFIIIIFLILIKSGVIVIRKEHELYKKRDVLLSPAERSFYGVLCKVIENNAVVFTKVRVCDVLFHADGLSPKERQIAFNKISAKHFDFVLCNPDDLSILAAIELDDSSHNSRNRIDRDIFLDNACKSANLILHRFKARRSYKIADISERLTESVTSQ